MRGVWQGNLEMLDSKAVAGAPDLKAVAEVPGSIPQRGQSV